MGRLWCWTEWYGRLMDAWMHACIDGWMGISFRNRTARDIVATGHYLP